MDVTSHQLYADVSIKVDILARLAFRIIQTSIRERRVVYNLLPVTGMEYSA